MKKMIILDRDGVINFDSSEYIKSPDEWHAIPGSLEAIASLNRAGFQVIIATNQSGVARGYYNLATLDEIHEKLMAELAAVGGYVEEIFFCPHHPDERCNCRKPKPGLFQQIQKKYEVDLQDVYFVGDSFTDVLVAKAVGCKFMMVLTGNGARTLAEHPDLHTELQFKNLAEAADYAIRHSQKASS